MKKSFSKIVAALIACFMLIVVVLAVPATAATGDTLYISAVNKTVTAGSGTLFTKSFNNSNTIKSSEGNFKWVTIFAAEPTSKTGVFKVTYVGANLSKGEDGSTDVAVTIPEGGFIYTAHVDDSETAKASGVFTKSSENTEKTKSLVVGDMVTITGVDITAGTASSDAVITIGSLDVSNTVDTSSTAGTSSAVASSAAASSNAASSATTSSKAASSTASSKAGTSSADTSAADDGNNTLLYVGIGAAAVVLIAVIAFAATRKKK